MQIFLIENVVGLGKPGEIKDVKSAYAFNFLLPQKMAVLPNDPRAISMMKSKQTKALASSANIAAQEKAMADLDGQKFLIKAKADAKGHLYGAIGPKEIAAAAGIDAKLVSQHFKETGVFPLEIGAGNATSKIQIEIRKI